MDPEDADLHFISHQPDTSICIYSIYCTLHDIWTISNQVNKSWKLYQHVC